MTRIELTIGGQRFEADLLNEQAPKTCDAFLKCLPIDTKIYHAAWSGDSLVFLLHEQKNWTAVPEENVSIYGSAGEIMWHGGGHQEFQLVHGCAQFRWKTGPLRSNIFARIENDLKSFDALARRIQKEGAMSLNVKVKSD
ncbi:MAG TPA: DUF3830 family protein [Candidatus Bathyarchaeia archaeon]|nr:DUF3830 family protein [Candidatus Bathyarchaeia archaeon]